MPRVLVVEAEPSVRSFIQASLTKNGFEVVHTGNCVQPDSSHTCALQCYSETKPPDVVIAAVISPRLCSGIEVAAKALCQWSGGKILLISATPFEFWPAEARALLGALPVGSYLFLEKPFTSEALQAAVAALAGRVRGSRNHISETSAAASKNFSRSSSKALP